MSDNNDPSDVYEPYVDDDTDDTSEADFAGGTDDSMGFSDESPKIEVIEAARTLVRQEIDRETRQISQAKGTVVKVSTNVSGAVLFQSYGVGATLQPMQICREKPERGDLVIVNYTDTVPVYIGKHSGIFPGGSDTVRIVGSSNGSSRTIRTREALWAVAAVECAIDVQEEFN